MLQIAATLTENSTGIIYACNMFIVKATVYTSAVCSVDFGENSRITIKAGACAIKLFRAVIYRFS
jgi:hypothetical protein